MDLLRFTTAGSIDDGKSTLIGKLLYDTGNIKEDVAHSIKTEQEQLNLAHVTDGLRSEREGGITIDIGYKYFNTDNRKFIIADAPGHFQYTKNLVTGASNVDLMIVLIDAKNGVTSQSKMHLMVASFLKLKHVLVAINKMDLVEYKESVFDGIKADVQKLASQLKVENVNYIPISALKGDNVFQKSELTDWYKGNTLLDHLNQYEANNTDHSLPTRVQIQNTILTDEELLCYGKMPSGTIAQHESLRCFSSGNDVTIDNIILNNESAPKAVADDNICLVLDKNSILERGDILGNTEQQPTISNELEADICWLDAETELRQGNEYILRLNVQETGCVISSIVHKLNTTDFEYNTSVDSVTVNEFARIKLRTNRKVVFDSYDFLRANGRGILIDKATNNTVAAITIV